MCVRWMCHIFLCTLTVKVVDSFGEAGVWVGEGANAGVKECESGSSINVHFQSRRRDVTCSRISLYVSHA